MNYPYQDMLDSANPYEPPYYFARRVHIDEEEIEEESIDDEESWICPLYKEKNLVEKLA